MCNNMKLVFSIIPHPHFEIFILTPSLWTPWHFRVQLRSVFKKHVSMLYMLPSHKFLSSHFSVRLTLMIFQCFVTLKSWPNTVMMPMPLILSHFITKALLVLSHPGWVPHDKIFTEREEERRTIAHNFNCQYCYYCSIITPSLCLV